MADVEVIPAERFATMSSPHVATVALPPGGLTLSEGNWTRLNAVFDVEFLFIENITMDIGFSDDLLDPGEMFYIPQFGGLKNNGPTSIPQVTSNSVDCSVFFRFADGRFAFDLFAEIGSFKVTTLQFTVTGVPKPEIHDCPPTSTVTGIAVRGAARPSGPRR